MKIKSKVLLVAVPVAAVAAVGTVAVIKIRKRIRRGRIMPDDLRASVEELLRLKGDDFVPDGLGTSLYHRELSTLTDRQLLGVYALIKVGEVMQSRGVDVAHPSKDQLKDAARQVEAAMATDRGRRELIAELEGFGAEAIQGVMHDGALLAGYKPRSED